PQGSAISDIMQMRQQGLSNNQIIQNLQRQGYSNTQIFDAMNQADTKMTVEGMQPFFTQPDVQFGGQTQGQQAGNSQVAFSNSSTSMPVMETGAAQPAQVDEPEQVSAPQPSYRENQVKVEELVEAIIEEKWEELLKDVNKIVNWKNKVEQRVSEIEIHLEHLKESYSEMQKAILGKVNDYDKHIMEVGSEIKAMEKVFSKVLPSFAENVNELSNIANKFKEVSEK
ncbi:MAG: hypothetical protein ABIJ34_00135, partial [archaeon]